MLRALSQARPGTVFASHLLRVQPRQYSSNGDSKDSLAGRLWQMYAPLHAKQERNMRACCCFAYRVSLDLARAVFEARLMRKPARPSQGARRVRTRAMS